MRIGQVTTDALPPTLRGPGGRSPETEQIVAVARTIPAGMNLPIEFDDKKEAARKSSLSNNAELKALGVKVRVRGTTVWLCRNGNTP